MNRKKVIRILVWTAFVFYCFALVYVLFLNARSHRYQGESVWDYIRFSVNLIPFKTIGDYISKAVSDAYFVTLAVRNVGGNLILFLPMGIFLPTLFPQMRGLWKTILCIFLMVLSAEIIQLFLRLGIFDIDDFILNITGAFLGYLIFKVFQKIYCKKISSCGILNERKDGAIDGNQIE
ncbi:MAG: VanZ family protein [Clostridia bacterium]|nr:VanZ family protein [Clostridia bacterium]